MAEIVLSPLVELVLENLISITRQEINLVRGVRKELEKLSSTLSTIRDVLEDAEEKQVTERTVRNWLNKLKYAAYDADDILDEYATEALRFKVEEGRARNHHPGGQVCNFSFFSPCFCINRVKFRCNIGHKIKEIRERIDEINKERSDFQLEERPISERRLRVESNRETGSYVDESTVIGRDADKERIRDLLLSSDYNNRSVGGCCVIPIVGFGGLGKTTLAQCVFNEKRVQEHFELKMWVCVSTEFEVRRLIKEIIGKATNGEAGYDLLDLDGLHRRLLEKLTGKRYLLVLDDVWNEDYERWESLRDLLRCGGSGSRIIVTTRSKRVSSIMQTTDPIHLEGLSDEDCWTLFARRAFRDQGEQVMYPKLVEIGKQIVGKCSGVPLAVKTLGGLMNHKREESEWLSILQSGMLDIPEDENGILNSLRLSYNHLPSHLKPCFAFCSIFPKDSIIDKNKLIKIWMAQGFIIQPSIRSKLMEDVGSEYFNFLLHRCFFQEVREDEYGSIKSCKMHDLFHDLAQSVAGNECRVIEDGRSMDIIPNKVLYLSFSNDSTIPPYEYYRLRTILQIGWQMLNADKCIYVKFKCLRVLDLSYCRIAVLPNSIGNLKHLRYLDISNNHFNTLPGSICSLWNLQTLKIIECGSLSELPKDMKSMINLRHLEIDVMNQLSFMPVDIGKLTCLQTLPIFNVGEGGASIRELGCLKNLRGELEIRKLENVKNMEDAKEEVLKDKEYLYSLKLFWNVRVDGVVSGQHEEGHIGVLESLKPHTNLKSLFIFDFNGAKFPKWVGDSSFRDLVKVLLYSCKSFQHLPPFGQLKSLKELEITGAHGVKSIDDEFYGVGNVKGFPSLESLRLQDFPNLEEWSTNECQGDMCCLTDLDITRCPKLRALPNLPSLQELRIDGESKITSSRQGLEHLTTIKTLTLVDGDDIALTLEHHRSLETLGISDCTSIHKGLFQNLFNLTSLTIIRCKELKPLPETMQNLTSLRDLFISDSYNFASSPHTFKHLTTLKSLCIDNCEELECLPEELQYLTALDSLRIQRCEKLRCLPEGLKYLTALKSLSIEMCGELECLPEELRYLTALDSLLINYCQNLGCLPEGLKYLTALRDLNIYECRLLVERCERGGEDWHKISHIPNINKHFS